MKKTTTKKKIISKVNNAINVLFPYRTKSGMWVYDDEDLGVYGEAFVCGSSEVIDAVVGMDKDQCVATISSKPFPNYALKLSKDKSEEMPGWYLAEPLGMKHWLCSKVLDYFPDYPEEIYVKIEAK